MKAYLKQTEDEQSLYCNDSELIILRGIPYDFAYGQGDLFYIIDDNAAYECASTMFYFEK